MARRSQAIQIVIAEGLRSSSVCETRPIADSVIEIVGLIDLGAGGRQLMQNVRHLRHGIIA